MNTFIRKPNFDYSQTLWMKMYLAEPDFRKNVSDVRITFDQALDVIKTIDKLTQGIKKIVYLVGWQGLGHDDCYPEMEVINEALKSPRDRNGRESLFRLFEEAKKFNTVVSFHGNLADAYSATPCSPELIATDSVLKNADGSPAVIEIFNGRDAYKISYKRYFESGLFKRNWDRFCEATPVREAGTVHLDNFCIAQNMHPYTSVEEEDEARNKMIDYITSLGIDVTTEYTYRELELRADSPGHPIRKYYEAQGKELTDGDWKDAPIRTLGRIPASWWTSGMSAEDCVRIPPSLYSGHLTEPKLLDVFYGAMHGEDIWMKHGVEDGKWIDEFIFQFCTLQLPYFYLNRLDRLDIREDGDAFIARFSDGVESRGKDKSILKNGITLKSGDDVLLPLDAEGKLFIAFSKDGKSGKWNIPDAAFKTALVSVISPEGNVPAGKAEVFDGQIELDVKPGQALAIKAESR